MGAAISAIRDNMTGADEKAKAQAKEQLDFLVKTVDAKLDGYQAALDAAFTDPNSIQRKQVPGIRALRWSRQYFVDVSKKGNDAIDGVVDSFFSAGKNAGKDNDKAKDEAIDGFKSVVKTGLDIFLGNTEAGEQEDLKFFVFMEHNALVRIDVKMWRYNFSGKGIMSEHENVFGSLICLSVVDHNALRIDELVYLLSEYAGDEPEKVKAYSDKLVGLWKKVAAASTPRRDRGRLL